MKKILCILSSLLFAVLSFAQNSIQVEAPNVVAADEQFNVTFIIEGEGKVSDFTWAQGDNFQLVWGPQKGSSRYTQIINGKKSVNQQTTFTYILLPNKTGTFSIPAATAQVSGKTISSSPVQVQVVTNGSSQNSQPQSSQSQSSADSKTEEPQTAVSSDVSSGDIFLRLSLSKRDAILGEPITATLKLYQRVDVAGFENAKFPSFNGFWSQETYSPTNIQFKRESLDDKIYNCAILRSYVLVPQQVGTLTIDPAELVCLLNVRATTHSSGSSIFDAFFQDDYKTIRKRLSTQPVKVKVSSLPSGQPASFGGGVGSFGISARVSSNQLKTHDAGSLIVTVSGRGNVSLLEEPKVNFPPDFEVYDTKSTENTEKSSGGTSGSKSFEFPFIPRSHGEFTIEPIEYTYYDVSAGKYVTLRTDPIKIDVAKSNSSDRATTQVTTPSLEQKNVKSLADDVRFISTQKASLTKKTPFFLGSALFYVILAIIFAFFVVLLFGFRKFAARKADVVGTKNRKATKMAQRRLKLAGDYLSKNLYSAFYEELHKALIGFVSDKLNMDMTEMSKENIASALTDRGVSDELTSRLTGLLDACEYARYSSSDTNNEEMKKNFVEAENVISSIDSTLKNVRPSRKTGMTVILALMLVGSLAASSPSAYAQDNADSLSIPAPFTAIQSDTLDVAAPVGADAYLNSSVDSLWNEGIKAYTDGQFLLASEMWEAISKQGYESAQLYYNLGDSYFKQNNYPRAILNFERALKLKPSFSDARYNLEFAEGFIQDKIEPIPEFILKSIARKVCYLLSSNAWATIFLVLLMLAVTMLFIFIVSSTSTKRRICFYSSIAVLVIAFFALSFSIWQKSDYRKVDTAIVTAPVVSAKSSPSGSSSKDLFIIHEGTKVQILDAIGDWTNISLADGRQGWVPSSEMEVI